MHAYHGYHDGVICPGDASEKIVEDGLPTAVAATEDHAGAATELLDAALAELQGVEEDGHCFHALWAQKNRGQQGLLQVLGGVAFLSEELR